MKNTWRFDC